MDLKYFIFDYAQIIVGVISAIATVLIAFKSLYELRKNKKNTKLYSPADYSNELNYMKISRDKSDLSVTDEGKTVKEKKEEPETIIKAAFELKQLENYYSQALSQSKISFWFSILFASIGFIIIIIAGFLYSESSLGSTIISLISGTVIDSVSALFFVQTRRTQQNMNDFFQKLREDKQYIEARNLCDSLESNKAKDALKIQLALNFSKISNAKEIGSEIIKDCLNNE